MSDEPIDFTIIADDDDNRAVFAKVSEAARRAAEATRRACDCGHGQR